MIKILKIGTKLLLEHHYQRPMKIRRSTRWEEKRNVGGEKK